MGRQTTQQYDIEGLADVVESIENYDAAESAERAAIDEGWSEYERLGNECVAITRAIMAQHPEEVAQLNAIAERRGFLAGSLPTRGCELTSAWCERHRPLVQRVLSKYPESVRDQVHRVVGQRRKARYREKHAAAVARLAAEKAAEKAAENTGVPSTPGAT